MNERKGEKFSVAAENAPVEGCTVSKLIAETSGRRISHFSLAANTDIGAETYSYHKLWYIDDGEFEVQTGFARLPGLRMQENPVNPVNPV